MGQGAALGLHCSSCSLHVVSSGLHSTPTQCLHPSLGSIYISANVYGPLCQEQPEESPDNDHYNTVSPVPRGHLLKDTPVRQTSMGRGDTPNSIARYLRISQILSCVAGRGELRKR